MAGASGLASSFLQDEGLEAVLVASAVVIALIATGVGYRRHRDRWVILLVVLGFSLLALGRIGDFAWLPEPVFPVTAAILLIGAHVRNARLLHRVRECCGPESCAAS
jgi:hypothetical protein